MRWTPITRIADALAGRLALREVHMYPESITQRTRPPDLRLPCYHCGHTTVFPCTHDGRGPTNPTCYECGARL